MITALVGPFGPLLLLGGEGEVREGEGRLVTRAKKRRSGFKGGQGKVLLWPMPREGVVATMIVKAGRDEEDEDMGRARRLAMGMGLGMTTGRVRMRGRQENGEKGRCI